MKFSSGLKSTGNVIQSTPQEFFDKVNSIFHFDLDVCALPENAKCKNFFTPEQNGLIQDWCGNVWCNPPYGRDILFWVEKACIEIEMDYCNCIVMLLPARTDTKWFQKYVLNKALLYFVDGRLCFNGKKVGAPFPCVLAIYLGSFNSRKKEF